MARLTSRGSLAAHRGPTIAPVIAEEAHMLVAEGEPDRIERHRQHALYLRSVVPLVAHDIKPSFHVGPFAHGIFLERDLAAGRGRAGLIGIYAGVESAVNQTRREFADANDEVGVNWNFLFVKRSRASGSCDCRCGRRRSGACKLRLPWRCRSSVGWQIRSNDHR